MRGDAAHLAELVGGDVDVVVCSMALQLLQPLPDVLAAVAAGLRPGGLLVATVPSTAALTARDRLSWLRLVAVLGTRLRFPNEGVTLSSSLRPVADEHRRFALPIRDAEDARQLVESLYLPRVRDAAVQAAVEVVAGWDEIGISIRRLIARRPGGRGVSPRLGG